MIRIDKSRTLQNCMVYGDDQYPHVFYILPDQPRFRIDDNGHPVFKLLKYKTPIAHNDGTVGGGFVIFDSEFVVPDATLQQITKTLASELTSLKPPINNPPEIRKLTYIKGTASLQLLDNGGNLVQKVFSAGKPSLYGRNICSFTAELSAEGATLAAAAFQGAGGVAQVIYDLYFSAALGPVTGHVYFISSKFSSFFQQITTDSHWYSSTSTRTDTVRETVISTQAGGIDFDFTALGNMPDADQAQKIETQIRSWGTDAFETAMKSQLSPEAAAAVDNAANSGSGGSSSTSSGGDGGSSSTSDGTGGDNNYDNVTRDIQKTHFTDFNQYYRENQAVPWHVVPQGTLPNITGMTDGHGNKLVWTDYYKEVDLNDPFFQKIDVKATVNADFQKFPVQSVDLHLEYPGADPTNVHVTSPDTIAELQAYIVGGSYKYKYSYVVNYRDTDFALTVPLTETQNGALTINVGDLGLIYVAIGTGAIDFNAVASVQVTMKYEDPSANVALIQEEFVIDKNNRTYSFQHVLRAAWNKPYTYDLLYIMTDGMKWAKNGQTSQSQELFINDPFADTRTINVVATGDLDTDVANIFVNLQYDDDDNNYHVKANPTTLNKANPFFQWAVPVLDATAGQVSYSAQVVYKKGAPDAVPLTPAKTDSIFVGPANVMQVTIDPSLLDFSGALKVCKVSVHYADAGNDVDIRRDITLKSTTTQAVVWVVDLRDKTKTQFDWTATYYLAGPGGVITTKTTPLTTNPGGDAVTLLPTAPA